MFFLMRRIQESAIAAKIIEARSLTQILENEARAQGSNSATRPQEIRVYSPKLKRYVPADPSAKGEVQKYNIGLGPGSWY